MVEAKIKPPKDFMPPPKDPAHDAGREFSGKMPFRTTPEIHRAIYRAAKQAGKSVNAWMEEALQQMTATQLQAGEARSPDISLQSIQQLIKDNPAAIAGLVDDVKPLLKNQKMITTFEFLSAFEQLVEGWVVLKRCLHDPHPLAATQLARELAIVLKPALRDQNIETLFDFLTAMQQINVGRTSLQNCLKREDPEATLTALQKVFDLLADLEAPTSVSPNSD
jgi:hypothetical protein